MDGSSRSTIASVLGGAVLVGVVAGVAPNLSATGAQSVATTGVHRMAIRAGIERARQPQPGDVWGGCDDARSAGTAPIYRDEPGYRPQMDGDDDGIACEPIRY